MIAQMLLATGRAEARYAAYHLRPGLEVRGYAIGLKHIIIVASQVICAKKPGVTQQEHIRHMYYFTSAVAGSICHQFMNIIL